MREIRCQQFVRVLRQDAEGRAPGTFVDEEITSARRTVQVDMTFGRSRRQAMRWKPRASDRVKYPSRERQRP